ncbi:MAG: ATP-binding protein, partial [Chlorobi bacterium]|nr:ATP-binding protein [Chlorobiota bacterium]
MITELRLIKQNEVFNQYEINGTDSDKLKGLKKINVFVGANNTGKSRFLRELFKSFRSKEINNYDTFKDIDFPFISVSEAKKEYDKLFSSYLKLAKPTFKNPLEGDKKVERFKSNFPHSPFFEGQISFREYTKLLDSFDFEVGAYPEVNEEELSAHNNRHTGFIEDKKDILRNISYSVYIPILRSLKIIIKESAPLKVRVQSDYFKQFYFPKSNIFTG